MTRRGRYAADRGLVARMLVVVGLLLLLYVGAVGVLVAARVPVLLVLVVVVGAFVVQYVASDKVALYAMNARVVEPHEAPELHGAIDRLCALADTPKPRVALSDSDVPNAFATGRSPDRAVVCVTTGLVRRLEPDELEGVLAHELAHVAHRDVAVMTVASFLGVLAGLVTRFAVQATAQSGGGLVRRSRGGSKDSVLPVVLAVIVVSAVVYAVSFVLIRTLSRYRELSADRTAALLTGRPSSLASALTKITGEMGRVPTRDLRAAEPFNAFFFTPALAPGFSLSSLFSTHPTLERRLAQLQAMAG